MGAPREVVSVVAARAGGGETVGGVLDGARATRELVVAPKERVCPDLGFGEAPRLQLHAPSKVREDRANDPTRDRTMALAGRSAHVTGYALAHMYPPMMAASMATFVNSLASPLPTPAQIQAQSGLARVMWELGCRGPPLCDEEGNGGFKIREQLGALEQEDVIDRPMWALAMQSADG